MRICLDRMGFPGNIRDKCRELAFRLGVDEGYAAALLTGDQMPDFEALLAVCELTQKAPGYFLDPEVSRFPVQTRVVRCIGVGEDLAICLPEDIARRVPTSQVDLSYYRSSRYMGFDVNAGDYVLAFQVSMEPAAIKKDNVYLIGSETGFDLRRCVVQTPVRATFTSFDGRLAQTIKPSMAAVGKEQAEFLADGFGEEIHSFAEVVGMLRGIRTTPLDPNSSPLLR